MISPATIGVKKIVPFQEAPIPTKVDPTKVDDHGSSVGVCYNRAMPTVFRSGPYRFYFYSHEPNEPPHVHVDRDEASAKFWLDPVQLAANFGFRAHELREIQSIVLENRVRLLEAWNGFFGSSGG